MLPLAGDKMKEELIKFKCDMQLCENTWLTKKSSEEFPFKEGWVLIKSKDFEKHFCSKSCYDKYFNSVGILEIKPEVIKV